MNKTDRGFDSPGDTNVDLLLREFFEREMPPELRRPPELPRPASRERANRDTARGVARQKSEWPALTVLAGYLLLSAAALSLPLFPSADGSRHSDGGAGKRDGQAASAQTVASSDTTPNRGSTPDRGTEPASATAELEVSVSENIEAIERYDTAGGPVEQRSKLRIKNVSIYDPETGSKVELMLPELDIEIFPIEEDEEEDVEDDRKAESREPDNGGNNDKEIKEDSSANPEE